MQNNDYYSVQSTGSSRNVSTNQAQTATMFKKGSSLIKEHNTPSAIRNSTSSRNANYTMIKSSNIVVTQPIATSSNMPNHGGRTQKNMINYHFTNSGGSPPYKGQRTTVTNTSQRSAIHQQDSSTLTLIPVSYTKDANLRETHIKISQTAARHSIDHTATSVDRQKARGQSATSRHDAIGTHQRLSIVQQTILHQKMPAQGVTRRTSTLGTPISLCNQHSKPIISPLKSVLQQHNLQSNALVQRQNTTQTKERLGQHQTSSSAYAFPTELIQAQSLQSNSMVQTVTMDNSIIPQQSPKQPPIPPSLEKQQQNNFKSPVNTNKKSHYNLSSVLSSGGSSPQPSNGTGRHANKGITSRLSTGGGTIGVTDPQSMSVKKTQRANAVTNLSHTQQTPKIIHSKIIKGSTTTTSAGNFLQIDLNQISQTTKASAVKNGIQKKDSLKMDDQSPFQLYGASGEIIANFTLGTVDKKQAPSIVPPQPMLLQLNSQSPQASSAQFFARSPKASTTKLVQSSNRHSILNTTTTQQNTSRITQQQSTFNQQTKSSLAKATKQQQATATSSQVLKSKTQRMQQKVQQKTYLVSKVPSKFETSSKKVSEVKQQVFEIVPPPSFCLAESSPQGKQSDHSFEMATKIDLTAARSIEIDATHLLGDIVASGGRGELCKSEQQTSSQVIQDISPLQVAFNESLVEASASIEEIKREYPISSEEFIQKHKDVLTTGMIDEMRKDFSDDLIYYPGLCLETETECNPEEQEAEPKAEGLTPVENERQQANAKEKYDDEEGYYRVHVGDHLLYRYEILRVLGKGSFAQVIAARDHKLLSQGIDRIVAIKLTRNTELDRKFAQSEAKLLKYLMVNDSEDEHNIVRLFDEFVFREHHCFVFELLPKGDLFEQLKANGFQGFPLSTIKHYAREILKALVFLESHKIIHCDLKPENILLFEATPSNPFASSKSSLPNKLKLVDFGSGSFRGEQVYTYVQSRFYRAPEVIMRLLPPPHSYTEKVDIWSLGCILAELFTGEPLFPGNNEQEQLELIMELCGIPPASFIERCRKKDHYFDVDYSPFLIEDEEQGIMRIPDNRRLENVLLTDDSSFIDFIRRCLELDPDTRFGASQAIEHPWVKEQRIQDPLIGNRVDWMSHHSVSQDSCHLLQERGLTAPMETDEGIVGVACDFGEGEGLNITREDMHGSERHYLQEEDSIQKPMLTANSVSSSQVAFMNASNSLRVGRREEETGGARGMQFEESPMRDFLERPKKTLAQQQQFGIKAVDCSGDSLTVARHVTVDLSAQQRRGQIIAAVENVDSNTSTPKDEGGIQTSGDYQNIHTADNFMQEEQKQVAEFEFPEQHPYLAAQLHQSPSPLNTSSEKRRDRSARKRAAELSAALSASKTPLKGSLIVQQASTELQREYQSQAHNSAQIQIIGQYEIFREDDCSPQQNEQLRSLDLTKNVRESVASRTSGIASEANIPPVNNYHGSGSTEVSLRTAATVMNKTSPSKPMVGSDTTHSSVTGGTSGGVTAENTINKITITFYQKRGVNDSNSKSATKKK